ncbi:MAG: M14 family metallopeptidase [Myxococcota bacterium]
MIPHVAFLALVAAAAPKAAPLKTIAETSGFQRTGRYDEVQTLCAAFPARFPGKVTCAPFGATPMGRPMLHLVASDDGVLTPEAAKTKGRPVLFLQGGIHSGEIDGKDAGFMLLRDLLEGKVGEGALGKVTVVFVPVLNVDGHERFGKNHRPNQRGPAEMGWRVTSQNLNLNRDFMKAEAPETQAVERLLHAWDPIVFADLHVTDGAKFQHDVSVSLEPWATGPLGLRVAGKALRAELFADLESKGHLPVGFYPAFNADDDPASGFSYGWPPPRFANAYWAANNRYGVLVETHSWKDFGARVKATYDVCLGLVQQAARNGAAWLQSAADADAAGAKLAGQDVPLLYEPTKQPKSLDFLGYEYVREPSEVSGKPWVRYDEKKPAVWKVPFFDELVPSLTLRAPRGGYLVPPPHASWVADKLKVHGLDFTVLAREQPAAKVQTFRATPRFRGAPYEGRQTVQLDGQWKDDTQPLPAGTLFVPAAQPRLFLAMHLLEPTAPDSLAAWGFFNAHFEQKEYLEDYLAEAFARELLKDPKVKAEFDARLKDEAFAKDPEARLRFFYERHPSFDTRLNLVPVYRTDASPTR